MNRAVIPAGRGITTALICLIAAQTICAQDWPQWRGPNRDAVIPGFTAPRTWPDQLKQIWKAKIGEGHSSPLVSGGRIYAFSRSGEQEKTSCLDLATGRIIWQEGYTMPYSMHSAAVSHGKGPKSTPVLHNGKIFTLGIRGVLSCLDAATGRAIWRRDFSDQFKPKTPLYGHAMSPIVAGGLLIAHVGGHEEGGLMALEADSGKTKWSWTGDAPGYASPITANIGGVMQVVTQSQNNIVSVSASTGELLWKIPFTTEYVQNIVTPVLYKDTLIFSGLDKGTFAIRATRRAGQWTTDRLWMNSQVSMYMNSPVINGDFLYGLARRNKGQFFCMNANTGETVWTTEGREGENAAIVSGGSVIFFLTDGADLVVARNNPRSFDAIKKYTVADSPTWAHPVVAGNRILIKDESSLILWSL